MTDEPASDGGGEKGNVGQRFDRLPATPAEREVTGRASRQEVVEWWEARFGIPPETFAEYSFWEKGKGKIWILHGETADPIEIEAIGMTFLRTRQEHWKPTTDAVQRFGRLATKNVVELDPAEAAAFARGEDQDVDRWEGDWGYLIAAHELAGDREPIGVGLYVYGELRSVMPKGRREDVSVLD